MQNEPPRGEDPGNEKDGVDWASRLPDQYLFGKHLHTIAIA